MEKWIVRMNSDEIGLYKVVAEARLVEESAKKVEWVCPDDVVASVIVRGLADRMLKPAYQSIISEIREEEYVCLVYGEHGVATELITAYDAKNAVEQCKERFETENIECYKRVN